MPPKKTRVPIPDELAAEVMFAADRTCCVCHKSGKHVQIHHVDEDPSNNDINNLTVLCLECHAQTQLVGGFGRKLNASLVLKYRSHWLTVVQLRRDAEELRAEIAHSPMPAVAGLPLSPSGPEIYDQPIADAPDASRDEQGEPHPTAASLAGESFRNAGIVVTVLDFRTSTVIELNQSNYETGSEYAELTPVSAGSGAKYVIIQARVLNDAQVSIDLTCGYPIANHLVDSRSRKFDSIGKLYQFPTNPACNDNLQPGFEADMTWIYRLPADAAVEYFEFQDVTDFGGTRERPTRIQLESV